MRKTIQYVKGNAVQPVPNPIIIPHITNDRGGWGAGFVLALSNRWSLPEGMYRHAFDEGKIQLGVVQFVHVQKTENLSEHLKPKSLSTGVVIPDIYVANMCAQILGYEDNKPPIRMNELRKCMQEVAKFAIQKNACIHAPRFGSGLAGGNWKEIEQFIKIYWIAYGIPVTIYDFQPIKV